MLDLETLGLDPVTAPIIQIGAVPFRLEDDGPVTDDPQLTALRINVSAASNLGEPFNRVIAPDTVAWWASTNPALLVKIMRDKEHNLAAALANLGLWVANINDSIDGVWSNGATFDISMLEMAYKQAGFLTPWSFRAVRDVRTMAMIAGNDEACWTGGIKTEIEEQGEAHDALVDCMRQIRMVQQTWQRRVKQES
jgi:hypothetical protein